MEGSGNQTMLPTDLRLYTLTSQTSVYSDQTNVWHVWLARPGGNSLW